MSWAGGSFGARGRCLLAPNASPMTLDGTNTWVLRESESARSVVVDPGPSILAHLDAISDVAGDVAVVLLTHHHADHAEAAREFAERVGCGVRALDPAYRLGSEGLTGGDVHVLAAVRAISAAHQGRRDALEEFLGASLGTGVPSSPWASLAQGLGGKEAADMLGISEPTVRTHLQRIFAKTDTVRQSDLLRLLHNSTPPIHPLQRSASQ